MLSRAQRLLDSNRFNSALDQALFLGGAAALVGSILLTAAGLFVV